MPGIDHIELFLFDMDGVIYREHSALPHAAEAVAAVRGRGGQVRFLTNNSTRTRGSLLRRLKGMGIQARRDEIITSAWATAEYIRLMGWNTGRALVIGETGLRRELGRVGLEPVNEPPAELVVVGLDRKLTYRKLAAGFEAVRGGARFIGANGDSTFPVEAGRIIPGGGSIVAALECAVGAEALVVGKPNQPFIDLICGLEATPPERTLMIGDRFDTDILYGKRSGFATALVLTGITTPEEARKPRPGLEPDFIWPDLGGLLGLLRT